jgi:hypothetical protein
VLLIGSVVGSSRSDDDAAGHANGSNTRIFCCARGASVNIQPASSDDIQIVNIVANKKRPQGEGNRCQSLEEQPMAHLDAPSHFAF